MSPKKIVKWAGGKTQLLLQFEKLWPAEINRYYEPFAGSAAVFFHLAPVLERCGLNDINSKLIDLYRLVRDDVEALIDELEALVPDRAKANTPEVFYRNRDTYNALDQDQALRRSALFIYLNRTCFNGLYRENKSGLFNVPFGRYKKPAIIDKRRLRDASQALQKARLLSSIDFKDFMLKHCREGDLVYLDPPYVPLTDTANFTSYSRDAFSYQDQKRLADVMVTLHRRKVRWLLSNSFHETTRKLFVTDLFKEIGLPARKPYINKLKARRNINTKAEKRGAIDEYALRNYRD